MTKQELKDLLKKQNDEVLTAAKTHADDLSAKGKEGMETKMKELEEKLGKQAEETINKFIAARKVSLPGLEEDLKKEKFGWSKVVQALLSKTGSWGADAGREKEIIEQAEKAAGENFKSTNAGTGAAGGFLIPDEATNEVIELAIANQPLFEMGPRVLRGLRGELPIPKTTGRPTAFWVDEEEAPTESNTTFGEIVLRPHGLGAFTKISRRVLHQTSGLADQIVREELANALGLKLEQDLLQATSGEKHPTGLINIAGLSTTPNLATNGARFRVDKAASMMNAINVANLLKPNSNGGLIMRPEVLSGMKRERVIQFSGQAEANGMPVMNPLVNDKMLEDVLGYKIRTTTLLSAAVTKGTSDTCSNVIGGAFEQMVIGMWEGFELQASNVAGNASGSALTQRQIWIVAFQDVDMQLRNAAAFTVADDAQTVEGSW